MAWICAALKCGRGMSVKTEKYPPQNSFKKFEQLVRGSVRVRDDEHRATAR